MSLNCYFGVEFKVYILPTKENFYKNKEKSEKIWKMRMMNKTIGRSRIGRTSMEIMIISNKRKSLNPKKKKKKDAIDGYQLCLRVLIRSIDGHQLFPTILNQLIRNQIYSNCHKRKS